MISNDEYITRLPRREKTAPGADKWLIGLETRTPDGVATKVKRNPADAEPISQPSDAKSKQDVKVAEQELSVVS